MLQWFGGTNLDTMLLNIAYDTVSYQLIGKAFQIGSNALSAMLQ
jgi:hypothetical protein